ncbi:MAG: hypothetical protein BWY71_02325 [Planctomycetes bacterium ADurb.Bin412]|nr:MAG: hypothetical protein BWY71_02325 [Planctomycetes bacterium ADurb.Bin412]
MPPIGPDRGHRLKGIHHRRQPSRQRNLLPLQTQRIAAAVHPLMVLRHHHHAFRRQAGHPQQMLTAQLNMALDLFILVIRKFLFRVQQFRGDEQLPHIMQHRAHPDFLQKVLLEQAHFPAQIHHRRTDIYHVRSRIVVMVGYTEKLAKGRIVLNNHLYGRVNQAFRAVNFPFRRRLEHDLIRNFQAGGIENLRLLFLLDLRIGHNCLQAPLQRLMI